MNNSIRCIDTESNSCNISWINSQKLYVGFFGFKSLEIWFDKVVIRILSFSSLIYYIFEWQFLGTVTSNIDLKFYKCFYIKWLFQDELRWHSSLHYYIYVHGIHDSSNLRQAIYQWATRVCLEYIKRILYNYLLSVFYINLFFAQKLNEFVSGKNYTNSFSEF